MRAGTKKPDTAISVRGGAFSYFAAKELGELLAAIRPFLMWPVLALIAFLLTKFWPDNLYVLVFIGTVTVLLATFVWFMTRNKSLLGHAHGIFTVLAIGAILGMFDVMGWVSLTNFIMLMGVPVLCLSWSIRGVFEHTSDLNSGHLSNLFDAAGMDGAKMQLDSPGGKKKKGRRFGRNKAEEIEAPLPEGKQRRAKVGRQITGTIHLPEGETTEELTKRLRNVESAGGMPPGTMLVRENVDHAGRADVTLSDPRSIREPTLWPGPSFVGGSIADPISVGLYQNGTEVEFLIPETQIQIMGQVGSGKSLGAGWSALAEIVTRDDVVVWAIDITKGMQTLGPLAPALHRIATTPEEAIELLNDAHSLIKPRTNFLSDYGLGKWRKDCGIKYLVVWIEEIPDVMQALGKKGTDIWVKTVKAARSAGITNVWSLQRAGFDQVPTIARGQAVKWCFGVADGRESKFGLTKVQIDSGCTPELWGQRQPGMAFLDAPSVPDDKIAMPMRTWYWGPDDTIIKAHSANYSIRKRPYDGLMWSVLQGNHPTDNDIIADVGDIEDVVPRVKRPALNMGKPLASGTMKMDPDDARQHIRKWIVNRPGETVRIANFNEVRDETGYGRQWVYKIMGEFESEGLVKRIKSDEGVSWVIAKSAR